MKDHTITFIGGGNMASALIGGLLANGIAPARIRVAEPDAERRAALGREHRIAAVADNRRAIEGADVVIFAVKPQVLPAVAEECATAIGASRPLVMSIAAGVRAQSISAWLGGEPAVVRAMPNTPALVGRGAAGLYANEHVTPAQCELAMQIMTAVGEALWLDDEALIDAVTAAAGSGPAYIFLVIEAMEAAAIELGLAPADARKLVLQTALGAAAMAHASDVDAAELRRRVTSPGGTTAAALAELEAGGLRELFARALTAARDRGRELSGT